MPSITGTPYNFSGQTGTYTSETGSDRYVAILVTGRQSSNSHKVTSVDFGGAAATLAVEEVYYDLASYAAQVWYITEASIPTGSQTITLSSTGSPTWANVGVTALTVIDADQAAVTETQNTNDAAALNISLPFAAIAADDLIIATGAHSSPDSHSWIASGDAGHAELASSDRNVNSIIRSVATQATALDAAETITLDTTYASAKKVFAGIALSPVGAPTVTSVDTDDIVVVDQDHFVTTVTNVPISTDYGLRIEGNEAVFVLRSGDVFLFRLTDAINALTPNTAADDPVTLGQTVEFWYGDL